MRTPRPVRKTILYRVQNAGTLWRGFPSAGRCLQEVAAGVPLQSAQPRVELPGKRKSLLIGNLGAAEDRWFPKWMEGDE